MRYASQKADSCNYIGTVLFSQSRRILQKHNRMKSLEKALNYQKTALKIHEELGHKIRAAIDCYNEALISYEMKKYKEANEMLTQSRILCQKQEEKTAHHYPLMEQINRMDSQLNKRNILCIIRKKDSLSIKISKKRFLLNELKWWIMVTFVGLVLPHLIPFPISLFGIAAAIIGISFFWRRKQLSKIGISMNEYLHFSSYYYQQYIFRDLRTIATSLTIGLVISLLIPFPLSLVFGWAVIPLINYKITKNATERLRTITSYKKFYQKPISLLFDTTSML